MDFTTELTARQSRSQTRTTGILPVQGHGQDGRGTKFARRTKILADSIGEAIERRCR